MRAATALVTGSVANTEEFAERGPATRGVAASEGGVAWERAVRAGAVPTGRSSAAASFTA